MTSKTVCDRCRKPFKPAHCDSCYEEGWRLYQEAMEELRKLRAVMRGMHKITEVVENE